VTVNYATLDRVLEAFCRDLERRDLKDDRGDPDLRVQVSAGRGRGDSRESQEEAMTTDRLTDDERTALADGDGDYLLEAKALRLLDAATAKCAVQAAVIERVRVFLADLRQLAFDTDVSPIPGWDMAREVNRLLRIGQRIDEFMAEGISVRTGETCDICNRRPDVNYVCRAHALAAAPEHTGQPVPMVLHCPECKTRHIDEGEFATKVHHTHSCQGCGLTWRPAVVPTVGVQFLPGFRNAAPEHTGPRYSPLGLSFERIEELKAAERDLSALRETDAELLGAYNAAHQGLAAANARVAELERELQDNALAAVKERTQFRDRILDLETRAEVHAQARREYAERVGNAEPALAAATARVAELEAAFEQSMASRMVIESALNAANARADAAEQWNVTLQSARDEWRAKCEAAEAQAAAATDSAVNFEQRHAKVSKGLAQERSARVAAESERAEWKAKCEAAEQRAEERLDLIGQLRSNLAGAESEVAALRLALNLARNTANEETARADKMSEFARVQSERANDCAKGAAALRAQLHACNSRESAQSLRAYDAESRLSTATELLERCKDELYRDGGDELTRDISAFLSTTPVPTERVLCPEPNHDGHADTGTPCPGCEPTEREKAERKVLAECERAEIVAGCHRGTRCCAKFLDDRYVAQAVLELRAVKA